MHVYDRCVGNVSAQRVLHFSPSNRPASSAAAAGNPRYTYHHQSSQLLVATGISFDYVFYPLSVSLLAASC